MLASEQGLESDAGSTLVLYPEIEGTMRIIPMQRLLNAVAIRRTLARGT